MLSLNNTSEGEHIPCRGKSFTYYERHNQVFHMGKLRLTCRASFARLIRFTIFKWKE